HRPGGDEEQREAEADQAEDDRPPDRPEGPARAPAGRGAQSRARTRDRKRSSTSAASPTFTRSPVKKGTNPSRTARSRTPVSAASWATPPTCTTSIPAAQARSARAAARPAPAARPVPAARPASTGRGQAAALPAGPAASRPVIAAASG